MHRDMKLANILVHFPEYPHDLINAAPTITRDSKRKQVEEVLKNIDLAVPGRL
jgi:hypothetical protein